MSGSKQKRLRKAARQLYGDKPTTYSAKDSKGNTFKPSTSPDMLGKIIDGFMYRPPEVHLDGTRRNLKEMKKRYREKQRDEGMHSPTLITKKDSKGFAARRSS